MKIDVFLDEGEKPFATIIPPEKFNIETSKLSDGSHELKFVATDADGVESIKHILFYVQNGPEIIVHGIADKKIVHGDVSVLINAYGAKIGDEFEPMRIETPTPIPTWVWILCLCVLAWGAGYISLELHNREDIPRLSDHNRRAESQSEIKENEGIDSGLGEQVYGNNCASCHQADGSGLPGVFPPLKKNAVVLSDDPSEHINIILNGLTGKVIDGVKYMSPMPAFGSILTDEEIAAVVNHERSQWGNEAKKVTKDNISNLR